MHSQPNRSTCTSSSGSSLESQIDIALAQLSKHSLADLCNAKLMNRVDSKFLLPASRLPMVLAACGEQYSALEIDGISKCRYRNVYFDTPELNYYHRHHNRKLNRHKVRHRQYMDTGTSFLEVKFKNNKGRTIKTRVKVDCGPDTVIESYHEFLLEQGIEAPQCLKPTQLGTYDRISFAHPSRRERVTLDLNTSFKNLLVLDRAADSEGTKLFEMPNVVIAELKQSKLDRYSPFYRLMREMSIRSQGFSKYCMGLSLTGSQQIKSNRFKPTRIKLERNLYQ